MRKPSYLALLAGGVFALFLAASGAHSADTNNTYQRMLSRLDSLKTYQGTIHSTITLEPINGQGRPNTMKFVETVIYEHPNKLSVKAQGLMGGIQVVSNGNTLYQYSALANQYTEKPAPADLFKALFAHSSSKSTPRPAGTGSVDGVPVRILTGTATTPQGEASTTFYVGQKDNMLHRFRVVLQHLPGQQGSSFRMVTQEDFTNQVIDAPVSGSAFQFKPPANSTRVSSFAFGGPSSSATGLPGLP